MGHKGAEISKVLILPATPRLNVIQFLDVLRALNAAEAQSLSARCPRTMQKNNYPSTGAMAGLAASAVLALFASGCVSSDPGYGRSYGHYRSGQPQTVVVRGGYYDYYPAYGVYYSRNRHEYVYRDRNRWVRHSRPGGISLDVLLASPSVRVDFHSEPWRHHDYVVRRYPRNWHPDDRGRRHHDDRRDRRGDRDRGRG
jgi:hypothetical protein